MAAVIDRPTTWTGGDYLRFLDEKAELLTRINSGEHIELAKRQARDRLSVLMPAILEYERLHPVPRQAEMVMPDSSRSSTQKRSEAVRRGLSIRGSDLGNYLTGEV